MFRVRLRRGVAFEAFPESEVNLIPNKRDMGDFAEEHTSIRANVIQLCKDHPSVKVDYRKLLIYYWYYIDDLGAHIPMFILEGITQPESISRAFRKAVADRVIDVPQSTFTRRTEEEALYSAFYRGSSQ